MLKLPRVQPYFLSMLLLGFLEAENLLSIVLVHNDMEVIGDTRGVMAETEAKG